MMVGYDIRAQAQGFRNLTSVPAAARAGLDDIIKQLPLLQRAFYDSLEHRTCNACGHVAEQPEGWSDEVALVEAGNPYSEDPLTAVRGRSW